MPAPSYLPLTNLPVYEPFLLASVAQPVKPGSSASEMARKEAQCPCAGGGAVEPNASTEVRSAASIPLVIVGCCAGELEFTLSRRVGSLVTGVRKWARRIRTAEEGRDARAARCRGVGGNRHSIAITADGAVFAWGQGEHGCLGHGEDLSNQLLPKKVEAWPPNTPASA